MKNLKNTIIALEKKRTKAFFKQDKKMFSTLVSKNFMEIIYFGRVTKEQLFRKVFPFLTVEKYKMKKMMFKQICEHVVLLSYLCEERITFKKEPIEGIFHVSAMYTKEGKKWKLTLWQITPLTV